MDCPSSIQKLSILFHLLEDTKSISSTHCQSCSRISLETTGYKSISIYASVGTASIDSSQDINILGGSGSINGGGNVMIHATKNTDVLSAKNMLLSTGDANLGPHISTFSCISW